MAHTPRFGVLVLPNSDWSEILRCSKHVEDLGFDLADNQLNDVFVRFKALADRKKEVFEDDLIALMRDQEADESYDRIQVKFLRVICGTEAPQSADLYWLLGPTCRARRSQSAREPLCHRRSPG